MDASGCFIRYCLASKNNGDLDVSGLVVPGPDVIFLGHLQDSDADFPKTSGFSSMAMRTLARSTASQAGMDVKA